MIALFFLFLTPRRAEHPRMHMSSLVKWDRALDLEVPHSLQLLADEVIEQVGSVR
jgi:hypothetical protein